MERNFSAEEKRSELITHRVWSEEFLWLEMRYGSALNNLTLYSNSIGLAEEVSARYIYSIFQLSILQDNIFESIFDHEDSIPNNLTPRMSTNDGARGGISICYKVYCNFSPEETIVQKPVRPRRPKTP